MPIVFQKLGRRPKAFSPFFFDSKCMSSTFDQNLRFLGYMVNLSTNFPVMYGTARLSRKKFMPAAPLPRNARSEKLWFEYDAYAKLENAITFLATDLEVVAEYLQTNPGPLPSTLVEQFADNLQDFKKDAEE